MTNTRLACAIHRVARDYPFHAGMLRLIRFERCDSIETMGVRIHGGRVICHFNLRFLQKCTTSELVGVLLHELHHIILGHLTADPADFPNRNARTIAEEVTVNEFIREDLPGCPLTLGDFAELLPAGESTRTRYFRLAQRIAESRDRPNSWLLANAQPLDNHEMWQLPPGGASAGRLIIADMMRKVCASLPKSRDWGLCHELRECVETVCQRKTGHVDWRIQLRRHVSSAIAIRPLFHRAPRRFPDLVGVVPAFGRSTGKPRVLAAIDTSGSISNDILASICGELACMSKAAEVLVVECDDQIQAGPYRYRRAISTVHGRGGTDFRPVFERAFLRAMNPDLVIYFTDGFGEAPLDRDRPRAQVIWCIVPGGKKPVEWGLELHLDCAMM